MNFSVTWWFLISVVKNGLTQPTEWWIIVCFHCRYLASIAKKSLSARRIRTPSPAPSMSLTGWYRKNIMPEYLTLSVVSPAHNSAVIFDEILFTFSFRRSAGREREREIDYLSSLLWACTGISLSAWSLTLRTKFLPQFDGSDIFANFFLESDRSFFIYFFIFCISF